MDQASKENKTAEHVVVNYSGFDECRTEIGIQNSRSYNGYEKNWYEVDKLVELINKATILKRMKSISFWLRDDKYVLKM